MISVFSRLRGMLGLKRSGKKRAANTVPSKEAMKPTDFQSLTESSADVILRVGLDMRASYVSPSNR